MFSDSSLGNSSDRRSFLAAGVGATTAGLAALSSSAIAAESSATGPIIKPGDTILFQGDSITDAGRKRELADKVNNQAAFGNGYAWMAASALLVGKPEMKLKFFNRGISGNKVYQLAERWQAECIDLKPNVLSILIGVNDIWHSLGGDYKGTVNVYKNDYMALLKRTKDALPDVKLVICEPFVLKCGAVNDKWFPEFDGYREAAKSVAEQFDAIFIPFQGMFDRAVEYAPPEHWAGDGVHPSPTGAALMSHCWLQGVGLCS
jgi:lysophospholipase L1-like esterase